VSRNNREIALGHDRFVTAARCCAPNSKQNDKRAIFSAADFLQQL
jgi:hypothetical protein